jgi:hypothetical protein
MKMRKSSQFGLTSRFQFVRRSMAWATLCLGLCMLGFPVSAGAHKGTVITFDPPDAGKGAGQGTNAWGITPQGAIIGWYVDGSNAIHGFLRTPRGAITTIDASGAGIDASQGTFPVAMNAEGVIAGTYLDASYVFHGFLRAPDGRFMTVDDAYAGTDPGEGTRVTDINAAGTIAGWSDAAGNVNHIFLRGAHGGTTEFYAPGAGNGDGQGTYMPGFYGLTPAGAITGWYVDGNNVMHGYLRGAHASITEFDASGAGTDSSACLGAPVPPGWPPLLEGTQPVSANSEGAVTGSYGDQNCAFHGFLRGVHGRITEFDAPGAGKGTGQGTFPVSNNPAGVITGYYVDKYDVVHGFVRYPDGKFTTIDVPGAGTADFEGTFSYGNNPAGVCMGSYVDGNGASHGFLWIP